MGYIVGFRKIISCKMDIKNIPSSLKKQSWLSSHLELLFEKKNKLCSAYSALKVIYSSFCFI
jgi:hypothetical protein